jgi:hypothetical protein
MSTYEVTRHIRSVVNLGEACEIHGIRFQPVVPFQSEHGVSCQRGSRAIRSGKRQTNLIVTCFQWWMP